MAYVQRDPQGNIIDVFETAQADAIEYMSPNTPELLSFLRKNGDVDAARTILSSSDMALIRVLEDLINTLIDKGVILFTDLPPAAQEKLANREKIRDQLSSLENLMNEDQGLL